MGNCIVKIGEQISPNLLFLLHDVEPHLIHQCLGGLHATSQTPTPTVHALSHSYAADSLWLQWGAPYSPPKLPLPVDRSPAPNTSLIPGPVRPTMLNGIRIRSAVFTARRYTSAVLAVVVCLSVRVSVCLSACHKPVLYQNGYR